MSENKNLEEEVLEEGVEKNETVEIPKPTIPVQKVSRVPSFPNGNHFGKGAGNFNMNSKQRPGRAASRGR